MQHAEALNASDASGVALCKAAGVREQAHASGTILFSWKNSKLPNKRNNELSRSWV